MYHFLNANRRNLDPVITAIENRMAVWTRLPPSYQEDVQVAGGETSEEDGWLFAPYLEYLPLPGGFFVVTMQVLHYGPSNNYGPHQDGLERVLTVLLYLVGEGTFQYVT